MTLIKVKIELYKLVYGTLARNPHPSEMILQEVQNERICHYVGHGITREARNGRQNAQTLNYLKATGLRLGIVLNFGPAKMEYKRIAL